MFARTNADCGSDREVLSAKSGSLGSTSRPDRRAFLRSAAAGSVLAMTAPAFLRGRNLNDKLNIAVIGCGGRGGANMRSLESENIVAVCDVNEAHLNFAGQRHPNARTATDFRKLFDHAGEFDAVAVSTCEHTHAFATLPALQLGKHVYCEKPLTHNVWEARVIREAANKAGVATQMGTQIHAGDNYRRVVELIQTGAIGPVREVHVWVSRAWGWQPSEAEAKKHGDIVFVQERPKGSDPVPANLDWDLWLGPAPERPFHNVYFPGPKWYRWWDFGNGTMSDLGSHWIDLPFWALKLDRPLTIEASGPPVNAEIAPASMQVTYEYGQRGDLPPAKVSWYQGVNKPPIWARGEIPQWGNGVLFIGDEGMLLADYGKHTLLPEDKFADFKRPEPFIPASRGHHAEWVHACKTGEPTTCNFEYAGWLTEANHLGNVAYRAGKKLEWDAENLRATNAPEADPYIRREYRKGWTLA
ncbi:MAG: Gfo/Idh/MocA family oxidoreductase [Planctomycetales bacterium]|nr:Gfo/Idh/MocA family oxidoreductase [Planctomycetales bacterium]